MADIVGEMLHLGIGVARVSSSSYRRCLFRSPLLQSCSLYVYSYLKYRSTVTYYLLRTLRQPVLYPNQHHDGIVSFTVNARGCLSVHMHTVSLYLHTVVSSLLWRFCL